MLFCVKKKKRNKKRFSIHRSFIGTIGTQKLNNDRCFPVRKMRQKAHLYRTEGKRKKEHPSRTTLLGTYFNCKLRFASHISTQSIGSDTEFCDDGERIKRNGQIRELSCVVLCLRILSHVLPLNILLEGHGIHVSAYYIIPR